MSDMIWNTKLISSPFHSNLEVAGELIIKLHAPYSNDEVTVKINPNITEYRDDKGKNIRQLSISRDTDETKTLQFNLKNNNVQRINFRNKDYQIKLMSISKIKEEGQDFPCFEFLVEQL